MKLLILSLLLLYAFAEARTRIVGGSVANIKHFPYMVSLQTEVNGKQTHICGGAILDNNWVLTAAHCVTDLTYAHMSKLHIVAGVTNWTQATSGQRTKVAVINWHPKYDNEHVYKGNDIALIKSEIPFVYGDTVKPVTLPTKQDATPTGAAWLAGWGSITNGFYPLDPDLLQFTILDLIDNCKYVLREFYEIPVEATVCTYTVSASACIGDSGGALVQGMEVVGIVSWGDKFCAKGPTVYTKVSHYLSYIQEIIKES